jgi:drug/metabolite transporter (DMT)-like permease|tara:strand:+ start:519 stop:1379 length:861 start_codon:yes stop_codon:yes gene_type:complete
MLYLFISTIIWAFSFSIIGNYLSPSIDPWSLSLLRVIISFLIFLPFANFKIHRKRMLNIAGIGAIQIGFMYSFYLNAFRFISVEKILFFTIFTPIYVTLISDLFQKKIQKVFLFLSLFSVLGSLIIRITEVDLLDLKGFILIQGANFSFALGQVLYRRYIKNDSRSDYNLNEFVYFYFGALIIASLGSLIMIDSITYPKSLTQWLLVFWLGAIASGLGYYFWNRGSVLVSNGTLAVMNNLVIPLGLLIEIIFFSKSINVANYVIGALIIISSIYFSFKRKMDVEKS